MSSDNDGRGPDKRAPAQTAGSVSYLLFDSLVHHLIEKGVLTKNDALSVVQTAAQVVQSRMQEDEGTSSRTIAALDILQRTYSSFEALQDRSGASQMDGHNIHPLRPPIHGDRPQFPSED